MHKGQNQRLRSNVKVTKVKISIIKGGQMSRPWVKFLIKRSQVKVMKVKVSFIYFSFLNFRVFYKQGFRMEANAIFVIFYFILFYSILFDIIIFLQGFVYAGLQNGNECHCSDSFGKHGKTNSDGDCNKPCTGDPNQMCGAGWKNSIYTTGNEEREKESGKNHIHDITRSYITLFFSQPHASHIL